MRWLDGAPPAADTDKENSIEMVAAKRARRRRLGARAMAVAVAVGAALGVAAPAQADFGIQPGTFTTSVLDDAGAELTQAGAHPNASTAFVLNTRPYGSTGLLTVPDENLKDVTVDLPVGVVGNPTAVPTCPMDQFSPDPDGLPLCAPSTQVGVIDVTWSPQPEASPVTPTLPVYNLPAKPDEPARFGFRVGRNDIVIDTKVRTGSDYGITALIRNNPGGTLIYAVRLTLWGVPAAASHDDQRFLPGAGVPGNGPDPSDPSGVAQLPLSAGVTPKAFFSNPTQCDQTPVTRIAVTSWEHPNTPVTAEATSDKPTGCDRLLFDPSITTRPETTTAAAPSGYDVRLSFRQPDDPLGLLASDLRNAVVTLPQGVVVSPSSADGLGACSPDQIGIGNDAEATCPDNSKIGTVSIVSPLVSQPLTGSIFLAQQTPEQLLRIYLVAEGSGVLVKLAGDVDPDPVTGQLTATFEDNPQLPVESIDLQFKGGPRAALANPRSCGPATTTASLSPWSGQAAATPRDTFNVDGPCPSGFDPSLVAGASNPKAGADSPFTVRFGRDDSDDMLRGISVSMPNGLLAHIADVPLCGEADANAGTCPETTRVGSTVTDAGPGATPIELPGRVYITGSYKGAPYGLSIVVPAKAGPFDLGTVVVRAAIFVDNKTAALRVVSDPLPSILQGIPLQIRLVNVAIDRPGFTLNPTNCAATKVGADISSLGGAVSSKSARFQVAGCAGLPFKPRMTLKVGSRGHTKAGVTTPLSVTLSMTRGQANNRVVDVNLPRTLNAQLDVVSVRNACTPEQYAADRCPQQVGTATAVTPLLRQPLLGRIFLVRNPARRLPDMMVRLRGQGDASLIDFDLTGKITIPKNLTLRTRFDTVPDVPITSFRLNLVSGRNAPVGTVSNLCTAAARKQSVARLAFTAQSGRKVRHNQKLTIVGCKKTIKATRASRKHKSTGNKSNRTTKRASSRANKKGSRR
jgi:hypothetical protein